MERGKAWKIHECLYGSEDGERRTIHQFVERVEQYPNLKETILEIESLVVGRGIHASGFYLFNDDYIEQNSLMKAPNGTETTCWDQGDSDYAGALKVDQNRSTLNRSNCGNPLRVSATKCI